MARERHLPTKISCMECGRSTTTSGGKLRYLSGTHLAMHGMTKEQYLEKYPKAPTFTHDYSRHHAYSSFTNNPEGHMEGMSANCADMWQDIFDSFTSEGYLTPEVAAQK